jgi:hypothetical protein
LGRRGQERVLTEEFGVSDAKNERRKPTSVNLS